MSETNPLQCGIVGAGIAGLAAAIALGRAGHDVEVFERSTFKNEIGAAITLTPNANLILDHWGFDAVKARETAKRQFRSVKWDTLELARRISFAEFHKYGHKFNAFHRADFHDGLREMAQDQMSVAIKLASEVCQVDSDAGTLTLADGTEVHKDLVVLADGDKSRFIKDVAGEDLHIRKTTSSVFRTLIPMDRIMSDETTRLLFQDQPSGFVESTRSDTGVVIMTYPCRSDKLLNCAIFHKTRETLTNADDWNAPATVEQAIEVLEGFHPTWRALIEKADFMKVYNCGYRDPLPRMTAGKVVLIGDAAHPMMPNHAQGGCLALEDAAALEVLMAEMTCHDTVEQRLKLYQAVRFPRCATTQVLSNATFYYQRLDEQDVQNMILKYYKGPLPPPDAQTWSPPIRAFFYPYDVFEESKTAMQYKDEAGGVPEGVLRFFGPLDDIVN